MILFPLSVPIAVLCQLIQNVFIPAYTFCPNNENDRLLVKITLIITHYVGLEYSESGMLYGHTKNELQYEKA